MAENRDGPRRGRPEVSPPSSTTSIIADTGDLDPDLQAALEVLGRAFGTDQARVLRVFGKAGR